MNTESWRAPPIPEGSELVFDEPGRTFEKGVYSQNYGVDCNSHHFRVSTRSGSYRFHVRHGGGDVDWTLPHADKLFIEGLTSMTSDQRFRTLWTLFDIRKQGGEETAQRYKAAFANGKLKKRKIRGQPACNVWIEN